MRIGRQPLFKLCFGQDILSEDCYGEFLMTGGFFRLLSQLSAGIFARLGRRNTIFWSHFVYFIGTFGTYLLQSVNSNVKTTKSFIRRLFSKYFCLQYFPFLFVVRLDQSILTDDPENCQALATDCFSNLFLSFN